MRFYHWLLIVIVLLLVGSVLNWPLLYVLGGLIFVRTTYLTVQKNRIKTCPPIEEE